MLRFLVLAACCSLLVFTDASGQVDPPSAREIALIRESWKTVSLNQNVPIRALIDLIKAHPKIQQLSESFGNVRLDKLPSNLAFLEQAHMYYVFAMDFVVANLDDEPILRDHLQRVDTYGKWYVDYVPKDAQVIESVRLYLESLYAEEPNMSQETKNAWAKGLYYAFSFMGVDAPSPTSGTSVLNQEEIRILRQSFAKHSSNIQIAVKTLVKLFIQHPETKKLAPGLENASPSDLSVKNPALRGLAVNFGIIMWYMVENVDNDELLTRVMAKRTKPGYFVSYIEPKHQLDEWTRLFLEAAEEEGVSSVERAVWKKVFDHFHEIMAANAPKTIRPPGKLNTPVLSGKLKGLIRDSWALARRNTDIAPGVMLTMFAAHPETKQLFPRLANVPTMSLTTNRDFLQASYNCFFGITWIVKNIDDMELVARQMWKHTSPAWFTLDKPTARQQLQETTRIFLNVMKDELGNALTDEQSQAWAELFDIVYQVMASNADERPLTDDDRHVLRDTWGIAQRNSRFGANALLKFLKAHPAAMEYLPFFKNVPLSELPQNKDFIALGKNINKGISSILANMEDPAWRNQRFKGKNLKQYYAPNIPIHVQNQETTRIVLDALDEELGPRFTTTTRDVWTRALRRFDTLFSAYIA